MTAIGSVGQLVAAIQAQLSGAVQGGARKRSPARRTAAGSPYASENLESLIGLRVRQIGRDDPNRGRKAFRVFLEAVLLSQFGPDLVNDAKFYQLVDDVQRAMEDDPASAKLVDAAIAHLLSEK
ncbi:hypothetical protein HSX11_14830 [Oxalobacteraceae bacterium]|nr:hypothetical protein [Oxalobacteraceae bacterium]